MMQHIVLIHPHGTRPQSIADPDSGVQIARVHSRGQTIGGRIADTDGIVLGLELGNGADGAEDLLLHDLHVFADVGEDGGFNEVALLAVASAADFNFRAFLLAVVDVAACYFVSDGTSVVGWALAKLTP